MDTRRWEILDTLRGAALVSMILYHACWDLVWIFGADWPWYRSSGAFLWQQSICWTFILLSGFCFRLGHHPVRRGAVVFGSGALITAVTVLVMPSNRVWCGVLSLLGAASLLTVPLDRLFRRIPAPAGTAVCAVLFALTRNINAGTLCFGRIALPGFLYRNDWTACLGFPPPDFFSTDYFSLIPWVFLFWTGYFLFPRREDWTPPAVRAPVLTAMGRHSLLIYLFHQPVIYGLLSLWDAVRR